MEQLTLAWHKVDDECWKDARRVPEDQLHSGVEPARGLWTNSGSFAVKGVLNR